MISILFRRPVLDMKISGTKLNRDHDIYHVLLFWNLEISDVVKFRFNICKMPGTASHKIGTQEIAVAVVFIILLLASHEAACAGKDRGWTDRFWWLNKLFYALEKRWNKDKNNRYIRIGRFHFKAFEKLAVKKEALNPFLLTKETNLESDIGNNTESALCNFAFFTIWNQNHRENRS